MPTVVASAKSPTAPRALTKGQQGRFFWELGHQLVEGFKPGITERNQIKEAGNDRRLLGLVMGTFQGYVMVRSVCLYPLDTYINRALLSLSLCLSFFSSFLFLGN